MGSINCLTPECKGAAKWKGLCTSCYSTAKKMVENGETSWGDLASMNLAQLDSSGDKFRDAFRKKRSLINYVKNPGFDKKEHE